jgi:hypothetical protein
MIPDVKMTPSLWWQGKKSRMKWDTWIGMLTRIVGTWAGICAMRFARICFRWSLGRCSWCGGNPGMSSTISRRGLRCETLERHCSQLPY